MVEQTGGQLSAGGAALLDFARLHDIADLTRHAIATDIIESSVQVTIL